MSHRRKCIVALWVLAGVVLLVFFGGCHAAGAGSFAEIAVGMTKSQVEEIMGAPQHVRHDTSETTAYFYGGFPRLKWCSMEVFFGGNGRVTGKLHDH